MKSAKSVRSSYDTDYQVCAQGNTSNPRAANKLGHKQRANARVGGTNNLARAMFGMDGAKMCKVITREVDTHEWVNGTMVRTNTRPEVTHTELSTPQDIPLDTLLRRAASKDMTLVEYCEFIGYAI